MATRQVLDASLRPAVLRARLSRCSGCGELGAALGCMGACCRARYHLEASSLYAGALGRCLHVCVDTLTDLVTGPTCVGPGA